MTPGVATDLVTVGDHALNDWCVPRFWVADLAFTCVVSHDEEGCWDVVPFQGIQQLGGVNVRPIVKCECDFAPYGAVTDIDAVWYVTEQRTRETGRNLVSVASWPVRELAGWSAAKGAAGSTNPPQAVSVSDVENHKGMLRPVLLRNSRGRRRISRS